MSKAKIPLIVISILVIGVILFAVFSKDADYLNDDYIKLAKYKGLTYKLKSSKVTDKELKERILAEREARSTQKTSKKGKVKKNDDIEIEYDGLKDFKGSDGTQSVTVGYGELPGDMDEQIVGLEIGKETDIVVHLPEDYEDESVQGRSMHYKVTIKSKTETVVPDYDEHFLKDVGYDSKEEYEKDLKKEMTKEKKEQVLDDAKYELLCRVLEKSEIKKYPKKLLADEKNRIVKAYKDTAGDTDWKTFLKEDMGLTEKEFDKQMTNAAKQQLKIDMVVQYIAKKEKLELTDKEYKANIQQLLDSMEVDEAGFKKEYGMSVEKYAKENKFDMSFLTDKITEFIYDNAKEEK